MVLSSVLVVLIIVLLSLSSASWRPRGPVTAARLSGLRSDWLRNTACPLDRPRTAAGRARLSCYCCPYPVVVKVVVVLLLRCCCSSSSSSVVVDVVVVVVVLVLLLLLLLCLFFLPLLLTGITVLSGFGCLGQTLKDPNVWETFQAMIGGKFLSIMSNEDTDIDSMITTFNTAVTETASEILGKHHQKKKPWVTAEIS